MIKNRALEVLLREHMIYIMNALEETEDQLPPELIRIEKDILGREEKVADVLDPIYLAVNRLSDSIDALFSVDCTL